VERGLFVTHPASMNHRGMMPPQRFVLRALPADRCAV